MGTWDFDDKSRIKDLLDNLPIQNFPVESDNYGTPDEVYDKARRNKIPIAPEWERCDLLDIYSYEDNFGITQLCGIYRNQDNPNYGPFADNIPVNNKAAENGLFALIAQYEPNEYRG